MTVGELKQELNSFEDGDVVVKVEGNHLSIKRTFHKEFETFPFNREQAELYNIHLYSKEEIEELDYERNIFKNLLQEEYECYYD